MFFLFTFSYNIGEFVSDSAEAIIQGKGIVDRLVSSFLCETTPFKTVAEYYHCDCVDGNS